MRLRFLRDTGLTSVMVVADFLRRRLAPLRERARPCSLYTGPEDITRTQIGASWDLGPTELRGMIPWREMALCANPEHVAIHAKLPEFDAQGLVDRLRSRSPVVAEIPGLDEAAGEGAASGPAWTGGLGAASGEP